MPIPPYVSHLRTMVGTELLWMPGVTAVVLRTSADGADEVLLVKRSDNGAWTPVTGIVDPGEDPHVTAVREVEEEACVVAEVERLVWVSASGVVTHVNGDLGQYLDHTFRCRWVSGEPRPGDDESTDARFFPLDALPQMRQVFRDRIAVAVDDPRDVVLGPLSHSGERPAPVE
ncbi:ADP-ribose pyrophosphatase [Terrabacter sp. Root85]|uniref:NUDIX hydrolase n=1 Tax=unclassified Terrabacter TaxID=2630222 RepID=UPI0006F54E8A|nr:MULTISPECIES: NUDIX domain-containing protein [unclassified Terrabacter]KRC88066.1 ADP-ribose pyrophosphatase [Terrabacter sp. Root85]KRF39071.1 ADP-ribose pyrophosphatase [Terrabacter sp. Soil811]